MSKRKKYLTCSRKYDLPLFCAAWTADVDPKPEGSSSREEPETKRSGGARIGHVVFGGGGGDRKNGVKNHLVLAHYDFATDMLSEAINTISTDDDPPYRLAVHPGSNEIVCSVSKDCRLIELRSDDGLKLEPSEKALEPLKDVGEQNCLVFSTDGTKFAMGGEDGHLRVFEWPSLELVLDLPSAHQSVKDLDFSLDSSLLVSTGDNGPCRIWDVSKASAVTSLSSDKGGNLGFCRFSRDGTKSVLFVTLREGGVYAHVKLWDERHYLASRFQCTFDCVTSVPAMKGKLAAGKGVIGLWNTTTWKKVASKKLSEEPISAFSISPSGKYFAIGSSEGDVSIVDANKLVVTQRVRSAHMVFVTSMEFSLNGRALLSVSGDSSARVTAVLEPSKREGWGVYMLMLLVLLFSAWLFLAYKEANGEKSVGALVLGVISRILPSNSVLRRT